MIRQSEEAPCRSALTPGISAPGAHQLLGTVSLTQGARVTREFAASHPTSGTAPTAIKRRFTHFQRCQSRCRKGRCWEGFRSWVGRAEPTDALT